MYTVPVRVADLQHSEYHITAVILQWSPMDFEVRYYADFENSQELGWRLTVPEEILTEKGKLKFEVITWADSVQSAETVAHEELQKLASIWGSQIVQRNRSIILDGSK